LCISFGWAAVSQQQFNQIRRQPSNRPNTRFNHSSVFDPHDAKIAASQVIARLKSGKADQIEKAQLQIKADLPFPETILAVVYETGSKYRDLDEVLSDLEKRRRRILEDYKNLQSARSIDVQAAE
jgi:hypothetical protein